jgi:hypothetical protein
LEIERLPTGLAYGLGIVLGVIDQPVPQPGIEGKLEEEAFLT